MASLPGAVRFEPIDRGGHRWVGASLGVGGVDAIDRAAVDHHARADERLGHVRLDQWLLACRLDHRDDVEPEVAGELEVALVVSRHGHDGAGAVGQQHIVGDPDRDRLLLTGLMA